MSKDVVWSSKQRSYKYSRLNNYEGECNVREAVSEELELGNRKTNHLINNSFCGLAEYDTLVDRPILKGESLASLSLKYRIPIAELKRVNKLQKETEFFALNSIKIPVKLNSALHEILLEEILRMSNKPMVQIQQICSKSDHESEIELAVDVFGDEQILREKKTRIEAMQFLDIKEKDFANLQAKTICYNGIINETTAPLINISYTPIEHKVYGCSGADWGISWWKMLVIGGIVIIGIPSAYFLIYSN